jgi:hypothetical protein
MKGVEDRIKEVGQKYGKLQELGLTGEIEGIKDFKKIANSFAKDGVSASGTIHLREADRKLVFFLTNNSRVVSSVVLKCTQSS